MTISVEVKAVEGVRAHRDGESDRVDYSGTVHIAISNGPPGITDIRLGFSAAPTLHHGIAAVLDEVQVFAQQLAKAASTHAQSAGYL